MVGDRDPDSHIEGPVLHSFRSTAIADVVSLSKAAWEKILANEISVPLISVREFDENGDLLSLRSVQTNFENMENELQPLDSSVIEPEIQHNMSRVFH